MGDQFVASYIPKCEAHTILEISDKEVDDWGDHLSLQSYNSGVDEDVNKSFALY